MRAREGSTSAAHGSAGGRANSSFCFGRLSLSGVCRCGVQERRASFCAVLAYDTLVRRGSL